MRGALVAVALLLFPVVSAAADMPPELELERATVVLPKGADWSLWAQASLQAGLRSMALWPQRARRRRSFVPLT